MANKTLNRGLSSFDISDLALESIMAYIDNPRDHCSISLVCRRWYEIDGLTRKHITIALCYTITPERLKQRFPNLESLKLKAKPRAAMFFNLIPEDWGGYAAPWINEIARGFDCLKSIHLRRMIVKDTDLEILCRSHGNILQELKLDKCSGFSTDGLLVVARSCRCLRTLFLEESAITENDGDWLHELALNNVVLETLNFYMTYLSKINIQDLEMIGRNCRSLVSLKISECEILSLVDFFRAASALEEFGGGTFNEEPEKYSVVSLSPSLRRLGLTYMGKDEMPMVFPLASLLKKLDLLYSLLDTEEHCQLIERCPNLEVLETRTVIGDRGLEVLAQRCKRLRRLRIDRCAEEGMEDDEQGVVSQRGLSALAQGCFELEYLAVYVSDITNASLEAIGTYCKNLRDFRLVLLEVEEPITELPLDNGVRALLIGCQKLRRFGLFLRKGGLTDLGLKYVGQYSHNIRWMILGSVGESDNGLLEFSRGCPKLQKLEMRGCYFSERAISVAVMQLASLRYLWVQGYKASATGSDLFSMAHPNWNIELIPRRLATLADVDGSTIFIEQPAHILAYCSLAGQRTDYPDTVVPLDPSSLKKL